LPAAEVTQVECETSPVAPHDLRPARNFAASYAGEHVAGTEFVIGALFVAWGVSTKDILFGLLLGNFLAVLTWGLVTAPIAVDTRLTLYAYLERIAGPAMIKVYSVVNGLLFCILGGAMITVSASAVRVLFDIPPQVDWYPTDPAFVLVAVAVGAVVVAIAAKGFRRVAAFAEICSPWMILMFLVGAIALWPVLTAAAGADGFLTVASQYIWVDRESGVGFWHVAAFAWICNLAMHGSLGDLTLLRFAKHWSYGFFSALGMFIGHYLAWICAGVMGAGAALLLQSTISELDPGAVAFRALGAAGILAVIIAGWTTSNPTIYRAGLAFQSLNHRWERSAVTIVAGIATTIIACFPFVFTKLLDFVGIMGLMLAPVGAVIVTEHWIFPRLGLTRYWSHYRRQALNVPAMATWVLSLLLALSLERSGVLHLFFLLVPVWLFATVCYAVFAALMGARSAYPEADRYEAAERARKAAEREYLDRESTAAHTARRRPGDRITAAARGLAVLSLVLCLGMAIRVLLGGSLDTFRNWLILPTLMYFVAATVWIVRKERDAYNDGRGADPAGTSTFTQGSQTS
jgi:cytosine permease